MSYMVSHWPSAIALIGMVIEIAGIFLTAQRYARVYVRQLPGVVISAIIRGERARDAVFLGPVNGDQALSFLQGLSFIAIGFILQTIPVVFALIKTQQQ